MPGGFNRVSIKKSKSISSLLVELVGEVDSLLESLSGRSLKNKVLEAIQGYKNFCSLISQDIELSEVDFSSRIKGLASQINYLVDILLNEKIIAGDVRGEVLRKTSFLIEAVDSQESVFEPSPKKSTIAGRSVGDASFTDLDRIKKEYEQLDKAQKESLRKNQERIAELEASIEALTGSVRGALDEANNLHDRAAEDLSTKKAQIDNLLGLAAENTIAGSFDRVAESERKVADTLRAFSVMLMAGVVALVSLTFNDSVKGDFEWKESAFRIALIFLITVPAAYLSRESSKHRAKYYEFIRHAMELKTFDPYMASLGDDDRSKLKVSMANKFFSANDRQVEEGESYPINLQELIMELVRRVNKNS